MRDDRLLRKNIPCYNKNLKKTELFVWTNFRIALFIQVKQRFSNYGKKSTKEEIEESERDYLQKSLQFLNFSLLVQACCSFQANTNWFGTKILISTFGPSDRCSGLETVDSPKRNYYAIIILDVKRNVCALMVWLAQAVLAMPLLSISNEKEMGAFFEVIHTCHDILSGFCWRI